MVRCIAEDELSSECRGTAEVKGDRHGDRENEVQPSDDEEQHDRDPQSAFPAKRGPRSVGEGFSSACDSQIRTVRLHAVMQAVCSISPYGAIRCRSYEKLNLLRILW